MSCAIGPIDVTGPRIRSVQKRKTAANASGVRILEVMGENKRASIFEKGSGRSAAAVSGLPPTMMRSKSAAVLSNAGQKLGSRRRAATFRALLLTVLCACRRLDSPAVRYPTVKKKSRAPALADKTPARAGFPR